MKTMSKSNSPVWPRRLALGAFAAAVMGTTGVSVRQAYAGGSGCADYRCESSEFGRTKDCDTCHPSDGRCSLDPRED